MNLFIKYHSLTTGFEVVSRCGNYLHVVSREEGEIPRGAHDGPVQ